MKKEGTILTIAVLIILAILAYFVFSLYPQDREKVYNECLSQAKTLWITERSACITDCDAHVKRIDEKYNALIKNCEVVK